MREHGFDLVTQPRHGKLNVLRNELGRKPAPLGRVQLVFCPCELFGQGSQTPSGGP